MADDYVMHVAICALQRIERTVVVDHRNGEDCRCPTCEARSALREIRRIYAIQAGALVTRD